MKKTALASIFCSLQSTTSLPTSLSTSLTRNQHHRKDFSYILKGEKGMGQVFIGALKQGLGGIRLMCGREGGDSLFCPCPGPHTWDRTAPQITIQSLIQPTEKFRSLPQNLSWMYDLSVVSTFFVGKYSYNALCSPPLQLGVEFFFNVIA